MVCKTSILHYFKCTVNLQTYLIVNVINAIYLELFYGFIGSMLQKCTQSINAFLFTHYYP